MVNPAGSVSLIRGSLDDASKVAVRQRQAPSGWSDSKQFWLRCNLPSSDSLNPEQDNILHTRLRIGLGSWNRYRGYIQPSFESPTSAPTY